MDTSTVTAEHIMTRHLAVTTAETSVMEATERLIAHRVSGLPVIGRDGKFVGRFSERSAIYALDHGTLLPHSPALNRLRRVQAMDIMDPHALVLNHGMDVFHAVKLLLNSKVSGAPVVDVDGCLKGVFSEQSALHVFIGLCWEQLPSSCLSAWLDRDEDRQIQLQTTLDEIMDRFQSTPYRRLMVLDGRRLVGQVTRLHALQAVLEQCREPLVTVQLLDTDNHRPAAAQTVASWMHRENTCSHPTADVLTISQQFLTQSARQIPVLNDGVLVGQISRSDLLRAVQRFFPEPATADYHMQPLYLSSVNKREAHALL